MSNPADGDRIDLGGKMPQFDAFAEMAYTELTQGNLDWIRIGDPEALKLDDIQYSTKTSIRAYQVKWSNLEKPEPFSYTDLKNLLPELVGGWQKLKKEHAAEKKTLTVHVLTNRPASLHDHIKEKKGKEVGTFDEFMRKVWNPLKAGNTIDPKWQTVSKEFLKLTGLNKKEQAEFFAACEIKIDFIPYGFGIGKKSNRVKNDDLMKFSRFLKERLIDKSKKVQFTLEEIISGLEWDSRFETHFNHELIVDPAVYKPITQTTDELDKLIDNHNSGYIFLAGGPGTGKSTLLTQWSKAKNSCRIIRYYVYDFSDPSSIANNSLRGEAVHLFYDMVLQLQKNNICRGDTLIHKDLAELRKVFAAQLLELGKQFNETGQKTLLIIDGLDHIPREYHGVMTSLLSELPAPNALPEGVIIVLGSQSYELEHLQPDVKAAWKKADRNVEISSLPKPEVYRYLEDSNLPLVLHDAQKQQVFEISQGHPLYLSYLVNKMKETGDVQFLADEITIDGNIETLYTKCWALIENDANLVSFLGLVSRINGDINLEFIKEWGFDDNITRAFNRKTSYLFRKGNDGWHFFHNSFRQFLITQTALSPLDNVFDKKRDRDYHKKLAAFYCISKTESQWHKLKHLFLAGDYDEFLQGATPEIFTEQFLAFRPDEEIKTDIHNGLRIAQERGDIYLMVRFMFALSELETRKKYITASSFAKQFYLLGENNIARQLIRNNNRLLVNKIFALEVCMQLIELNQQEEARLLFSLAEPESISAAGINVPPITHSREIYKELGRWTSAAAYLLTPDSILRKINNINFKITNDPDADPKELENIRSMMLRKLGKALVKQNKIPDLEKVILQFRDGDSNKATLFYDAAIISYTNNNNADAVKWLKKYKDEISDVPLERDARLHLAHWTLLITGDTKIVKSMIAGITQPALRDDRQIEERNGLNNFSERILLNKLLNVTGQGVAINVAVPASGNADDSIFVDFERTLCIMAQLSADSILEIPLLENLEQRVKPIIQFYYHPRFSETYSYKSYKWHKLTALASEYFKLLIHSVGGHGKEQLQKLALILIQEFNSQPKNWSSELQRSILKCLDDFGCEKSLVAGQLEKLESFMFNQKDISGRTDEAYAQADAWTQLDENIKANHSAKQALQQTLGIGYTKDNQFYGWMEWLKEYLSSRPGDAQNQIITFASFLPHIKETTELSTTHIASEALLDTVFEYNSSLGLQLMDWLLKTGVIEFGAALATCLKDQFKKIKKPEDFLQALNIYKSFYLYCAKSFRKDLLNEVLNKGIELTQLNFLETEVPALISAININALQENRDSYIAELHKFLDLQGIDKKRIETLTGIPITVKSSNNSNNITLHKDHKQLPEEKVLSMINDGKAFIELLQQEDKANSFFSWEKVLNKIGKKLTIEEISTIEKMNFSGKRHSELLAILSSYASQLGDKNLALSLVQLSLEESSSMGWDPYYDGGSRLKSFKALQHIRPETGYKQAQDTFIDDILQSDYSNNYIDCLDSILPVLNQQPDNLKVWPEIEAYVKRLMANSDTNNKPVIIDEPQRIILPDLLKFLYKIEIRSLKSIARKLIVSALNVDSDTASVLRSFAKEDEYGQEKFLQALQLFGLSHPDKIGAFEEQLLNLCGSENYWIRNNARKLMAKYLPQASIPIIPKKELPAIYQLTLPIKKGFTIPLALTGDQEVKDTDNFFELIQPYEAWLKSLSRLTGLQEGALLQRWGHILTSQYKDQISASHEQAVRKYLENANLNFPFVRPRPKAVLAALGHLLTELIDAGALAYPVPEDNIGYDFDIDLHIGVAARPDFVARIKSGSRNYITRDWINSINDHSAFDVSVDYDDDGWCIAGEYSVLTSFDSSHAKETICKQLTLDGELEFEDEELPFAKIQDCPLPDYHFITNRAPAPYLIIQNDQVFTNAGLTAAWIALNPVLALSLGWSPSQKGHFAWQDSDGSLMAESIYWRDGNPDMRPRHLNSESGEGWYVRISPAALAVIDNLPSPFFTIRKKIERKLNYNGMRLGEIATQVIDEWEKPLV